MCQWKEDVCLSQKKFSMVWEDHSPQKMGVSSKMGVHVDENILKFTLEQEMIVEIICHLCS